MIPTCLAIALAVRALSPVIITTSIPIFCKASTPALAESLTVSATAINPVSLPSTASTITVFPCSPSFARGRLARLIFISSLSIIFIFPNTTLCLPTSPSTPCPAIALNLVTGSNTKFSSSAFFTIASAKECSDPFSTDAASCSSFSLVTFALSLVTISVTIGFPFVNVPVLSKITVLILFAISRLSASLIKIPCSAPRPVPTIMAVGVANPMAQGQAIIKTAILFSMANKKALCCPKTYQPTNVAMANMITTGTK